MKQEQTEKQVSRRLAEIEENYSKVLLVLKTLEERLETTADRDDLTGLLRRKSFFRKWEALRSGHAELNGFCSILMIDIDYFKKINDSYGHPVGDEVIRRVARLLSQHCSEDQHSLAGRLGGEEFVVATFCSEKEALTLGEKLRAIIQNDPGQPGCTVSIGVATARARKAGQETSDSSHSLLKSADEALYLAKAGGRNRVCQAGLSLLRNTG